MKSIDTLPLLYRTEIYHSFSYSFSNIGMGPNKTIQPKETNISPSAKQLGVGTRNSCMGYGTRSQT